jgi:hypothetical protein
MPPTVVLSRTCLSSLIGWRVCHCDRRIPALHIGEARLSPQSQLWAISFRFRGTDLYAPGDAKTAPTLAGCSHATGSFSFVTTLRPRAPSVLDADAQLDTAVTSLRKKHNVAAR